MIDADFPITRGFGEPAPYFVGRADADRDFHFSSVGGRWTVLAFFGGLPLNTQLQIRNYILGRHGLFDSPDTVLLVVNADREEGEVVWPKDKYEGLWRFWDHDLAIGRAYGVVHDGTYRPVAFLIDPSLRIVASVDLRRMDWVLDTLEDRMAREAAAWAEQTAPVLVAPRVFEPAFCAELIECYERVGGARSGVMRQAEGMTVGVLDDRFKRRKDAFLDTEALQAGARWRVERRLLPMVRKVFGWEATRFERYMVACYDSADRGAFRPHRDNTTPATAHRKFAVTINLNDDYDGGALRFPEFGPRTYRPGTGGAVVFGCSVLHEATPVERGVRYAFVPFLYDEAGQAMREASLHLLARNPPATDAQD